MSKAGSPASQGSSPMAMNGGARDTFISVTSDLVATVLRGAAHHHRRGLRSFLTLIALNFVPAHPSRASPCCTFGGKKSRYAEINAAIRGSWISIVNLAGNEPFSHRDVGTIN